MKVVFLENVPSIAKAGEIKEVADGYGRNYLLPRHLAELATTSALKKAEIQVQKLEQKLEAEAFEAEKIAQKIEGLTVNFKKRVISEGRLYGSIRDVHIAQAIANLIGTDIDKGAIELSDPINQLGTYELSVKLTSDHKPKITVVIEEGDDQ